MLPTGFAGFTTTATSASWADAEAAKTTLVIRAASRTGIDFAIMLFPGLRK
jgi:hypothetical protein